MAENESLDMDSVNGRRWRTVKHLAEIGKSYEEVGRAFKKHLHAAIRRTLKQLAAYGVGIADFFAGRNSPSTLRSLLLRCKGHDYARLLVRIMKADTKADTTQVLQNWVYAVEDKMADQIANKLVGTDRFPSSFETRQLTDSIDVQLERDVQNVAEKMTLEPTCVPNALPDRLDERSDITADLLSLSLVKANS